MSQKDYKLEIIGQLLNSESHIRSIARSLGTNQMMALRKINELYSENAVDFRQEGRNKVYFLKKTLDAQNYAYIAEHYKALRAVEQYPVLRKIFAGIRQNSSIKLAVLFGSYAKGLAHKGSDIDIYLETESKALKKEVEELNSKISVKTGKYDPKSLLIKEIEKGHIIIKGVEIFYEKRGIFI